MKILFLDIDGVLNPDTGTPVSWIAPFYGMGEIRENAPMLWRPKIKLLNQMFDRMPNLTIVLSSSWRMHFEFEHIRQMFRIRGFKYWKRIRYITPVVGIRNHHRGEEVSRFLQMLRNENIKVDKFVCLDDNVHQFYDDQPYVQTNNYVGLTEHQVNKVLRKFK